MGDGDRREREKGVNQKTAFRNVDGLYPMC